MSETNTRVYELGFIVSPSVPELEIAGFFGTLRQTLEKGGVAITAEQPPEFIDLAYTMEKTIANKKLKYSQGYFGWFKFTGTPDAMEALKSALDGITDIVRYLLIKTDQDNIVVFKKPKTEAVREFSSEGFSDLDDDRSDEEDDQKEDHEMLPDVGDDILEETEARASKEENQDEE